MTRSWQKIHTYAACAAVALTASVIVRAQQPPGQGAAPKPLVPMTASTLLRDPAAHMGENVSLMGAVDAVLSKTAFTLDQDPKKTTDKPLLVIVPTLFTMPDLNIYVTVQGEAMLFDPAEIAKKARNYTIDLPAATIAAFQGRPVVLATVVISPALVDLAKKPPAPMTPAELAFRQSMLTINTSVPALSGLADAPDAAQVTGHVAALKKSFTDVEAVFKDRGMTDAAMLANDALKRVTALEPLAAAAKWPELKTAAAGVSTLCAGCHGRFRERQDDGSYRIKG